MTERNEARDRAITYGARVLADRELLELLGGGYPAALLEPGHKGGFGSLAGLARATRADLVFAGVAPGRADRLVAALELGRRSLLADPERLQFRSPRESAVYLAPLYGNRPVEHFGALLLDTRCRLIALAELSVGTADATTVHPREVFGAAIAGRAVSIVLFHNHPSGDPSPSPDDVRLTSRLVRAGEVLGIDVVDHVILGAGARYYSFRESGGLAAADA